MGVSEASALEQWRAQRESGDMPHETLQELQKELTETRKKLNSLEDDKKELTLSVAVYRVKWINEARRAEVLERYGPSDAPCLTQAGWLSSSPDRSYS